MILVLAGGAILPAPAVPASTRITARLKRVQEHSSRVNIPHINIFRTLALGGTHVARVQVRESRKLLVDKCHRDDDDDDDRRRLRSTLKPPRYTTLKVMG